jgi:cation diffusion facilitator CzcD-associated flavoprotein CzcO
MVGAISAAALSRENYFERIRVFERRASPGGTWYALDLMLNFKRSGLTQHNRIFDPDPKPPLVISPGSLPQDIDLPLRKPMKLPATTYPNRQERFDKTPIYDSLTCELPFNNYHYPI